ncbi:MAG: lamin tail domain-containing protein, partial [Candidatus Heimdallarchaeaceae archaeon]
DIMRTLTNVSSAGIKLKSILNTVINIEEASTEITYGLLALSALNEMDLIDLVVSQKYKTEARSYFNKILDERLTLKKYYLGISSDLPRILTGTITNNMSALTLSTFSVTSDIINVFLSFENIKTVKLYDGMWFYFDLRRNNETHEMAWSDAKLVMGWADSNNSLRFRGKQREEETSQIESQLVILWDKWGDYTTAEGVTQEAREQLQEEFRDSLVFAIKTYELVQKEVEPSIFDKAKLSLASLIQRIKNTGASIATIGKASQFVIKEWLASIGMEAEELSSFITTFGPGMTAKIEESISLDNYNPIDLTIIDEIGLKELEATFFKKPDSQIQEPEKQPSLEEIQENIDDVLEETDIVSQEILTLKQTHKDNNEENSTKTEVLLEEELSKKLEGTSTQNIEKVDQTLCEKIPGSLPFLDKIIINEIAWMGTINSSNDEWIELKNISKTELNLNGWQLISKDNKITINLTEENILQPNGFLLLERTDDSSVEKIPADLIYTGAIKNTEESLFLFNKNCQLQDEISVFQNWPAGENSSKRTMERRNNLGWQTSKNSEGTPKEENGSAYYTNIGSSNIVIPSTTNPPEPTPTTIPKILITEIQIANTSSTNNDFVELYNPENTSIDISDFQLKKKSSSGTEYSLISFSEGDIIPPKGYFLWTNSEFASSSDIKADATTTQNLAKNNSLALLHKEKGVIDAIAWGSSTNPFVETLPFYQNPEDNQNLGRKWLASSETYTDTDNNSNDFEFQEPTPGAINKNKSNQPFATFTYNPETPTLKEEIFFDASSSTSPTGEIVFFIWNFGEEYSTTTISATTSYTFATSGNYLISLIVVDNFGTTSSPTTSTITVSESQTLSIVINEVAWMGSKDLAHDEWIEFYNNTDESVNILDWSIYGANTEECLNFSE